MTVKMLGPTAFPKIPTNADLRAELIQNIANLEGEKLPYVALAMLKDHPSWPQVKAGIRAGLDAAIERMGVADGNDVYRCHGEVRAWRRVLTMADKAEKLVAEYNAKLLGLNAKLREIPAT